MFKLPVKLVGTDSVLSRVQDAIITSLRELRVWTINTENRLLRIEEVGAALEDEDSWWQNTWHVEEDKVIRVPSSSENLCFGNQIVDGRLVLDGRNTIL
jgi:hypothetical protein